MTDATDTYPGLGKVLVIIPTYNEAENVPLIVGRLRKAVPVAHILIADDNSPDGTGQVADGIAATDDHVHVLHRQGKEGLGAAYIAAFHWGLDGGYDALVEFDADGSHQPEELHRLLDALVGGADMVKGSRYVRGGSTVGWPKHRELLSRGGGLWTRLCLGMKVNDPTGGFNAFKADTLRGIDIDKIESAGYCFQIDLTWRATQKGFTVVEVPIEFVERQIGESKMDKSIITEALITVAGWGVDYRGKQLQKLTGKASAKGK